MCRCCMHGRRNWCLDGTKDQILVGVYPKIS
jgi:hypothetical protein